MSEQLEDGGIAPGTTLFDQSVPGRSAGAQLLPPPLPLEELPEGLRRTAPPALPEVSELQVVRHFTRLSGRNFAIDRQFYPLGSCTMKYNPRCAPGGEPAWVPRSSPVGADVPVAGASERFP